MSKHVEHATIVVERRYPFPPERVFAAFARESAYREWHIPGDGWTIHAFAFDFRAGGSLTAEFEMPGGGVRFVNHERFEDVAPNTRIVSTGTMTRNGERFTTSLYTVEFHAEGSGTWLKLTDQSAFYGFETPADRRGGWNRLFGLLDAFLQTRNAE